MTEGTTKLRSPLVAPGKSVLCGAPVGAVGSRTGAVAPEMLLIAGTGLSAAMFPEGLEPERC